MYEFFSDCPRVYAHCMVVQDLMLCVVINTITSAGQSQRENTMGCCTHSQRKSSGELGCCTHSQRESSGELGCCTHSKEVEVCPHSLISCNSALRLVQLRARKTCAPFCVNHNVISTCIIMLGNCVTTFIRWHYSTMIVAGCKASV